MNGLKKGLLTLAAVMLPMVCGASTVPADLGERLAQTYVRPAMSILSDTSDVLWRELHTWCTKPDERGASRVESAFKDLAVAWSRVEFLRFGPLVEANRFERLAFWPDTRGMMPKQVQALLAAQDSLVLGSGAN
jgi:uncharacterized protein